MNQIRTDLAIEMHELLTEAAAELSGVTIDKEEKGQARISRVKIETEGAQKLMGKPIGSYITIEFSEADITESAGIQELCQTAADELAALLGEENKGTVLAVGLGNRDITPDALGPKVVAGLMVTRHLSELFPQQTGKKIRSVCAIAPGVLGITGMETGEVIGGITEKIKPEAVIVIDALAARSMERIGRTIQICDTGISPGAGVGNRRKALNRETLGLPVIAIGVPTVIDAATITVDTLKSAAEVKENSDSFHAFSGLNDPEQYERVRSALTEKAGGFIVTPKDVDLLLDRISKVVANGINLALQRNLTPEDIALFTS